MQKIILILLLVSGSAMAQTPTPIPVPTPIIIPVKQPVQCTFNFPSAAYQAWKAAHCN